MPSKKKGTWRLLARRKGADRLQQTTIRRPAVVHRVPEWIGLVMRVSNQMELHARADPRPAVQTFVYHTRTRGAVCRLQDA
jgi:hypothetical protein